MTGKQFGEYAEAVFTAEAVKRGFTVCDPHGDSSKYDKVLDSDGKLFRVQIKATRVRHDRYGDDRSLRYRTSMTHGKGGSKNRYTDDQVDVCACFIEPLNTWYLVPIEEVTSQHLYCYEGGKTNEKYSAFRDNWEVFR